MADQVQPPVTEEAAPVKPVAKGKAFAKNQTALAKALGRTRKTIQRWRKEPGFPPAKPNGSFSIPEVKAWMDANGKENESETDFEKAASQTDLKNKKIALEIKKLEHALAVARKEFIPVADAQKAIGEMIGAAKKVLLSGPTSLAPQIVGVSVPEAEKLLRDWIYDALSQLSQDPTGTKTTPASTPKPEGGAA